MKIRLVFLGVLMLGAAAASAQTGEHKDDVQAARRLREGNAAIPRARAAFAKKDLPKAKAEALAILAKAPELSEAHFILAKVLYLEKDYPAALESMLKAETTFADNAELMRLAEGDIRHAQDRRKRELEESISNLETEISRMAPQQQAEARPRLDQMKRTKSELERAELNSMMNAPEPPPAAYSFIHGNILVRMNHPDDAVKQYQEALRLDPQYADAANNLASLYFGARQYDKAAEVLDRFPPEKVNQDLRRDVLKALGRAQ